MTRERQYDLTDPAVVDKYLSERVVRVGDCWVWTLAGHGPKRAYGRVRVGSDRVYAHRFSYEYHRAEIPDGLVLDHLCRNTMCINPWHLEPVTIGVNVQRGGDAVTSCPRGHEYTPENTYRKGPRSGRGGSKECRKCQRARRVRSAVTEQIAA